MVAGYWWVAAPVGRAALALGVCRGQRWSRGSREPGSSSTPASRGYTSSLSSGPSQKKQDSNSCHSKKQKIHKMLTSGSQTPAIHHRDMYTRIPLEDTKRILNSKLDVGMVRLQEPKSRKKSVKQKRNRSYF